MSPAKIDSAAIELATNAACDALASDPDLAWIRKSCLIERAYFLGLFKGLNAIAEEDALGNRLAQFFMKTYWSRAADDTFPSTRLGRDFAALEEGVRRLDTENDIDQQAIETVIRDIDLLDRQWQECVKRARTFLFEIQSASAGFRPRNEDDVLDRKRAGEVLRQNHYRVSELRHLVRYMALLETHHEMSNRLEKA